MADNNLPSGAGLKTLLLKVRTRVYIPPPVFQKSSTIYNLYDMK
ncbi:MAG: hypothetical protein ACTSU7_10185 [Candidatus Heimdallarchaeaceae archaeon]